MGKWSPVLPFLALSLIFLAGQASAQGPQGRRDSEIHNGQDHNMQCSRKEDCGNDPEVKCDNGFCECNEKDHIFIHEAKPKQCLPQAETGKPCEYEAQCTTVAGSLSRCQNKKCECYDTKNGGKHATKLFRRTCYLATSLGGDCETNNDCKASIDGDVTCKDDRKCHCDEGKTCKQRNGGAALSAVGLTLLIGGIMASKIVM